MTSNSVKGWWSWDGSLSRSMARIILRITSSSEPNLSRMFSAMTAPQFLHVRTISARSMVGSGIGWYSIKVLDGPGRGHEATPLEDVVLAAADHDAVLSLRMGSV